MIDYSIAHGYSYNDGFGSQAGVVGPQTSNQFESRESLDKNQDSVWDEQQAMSHQGFVSPQHKPVYHHGDEDSNNSIEKMVQSKPHSGQEPDEYLGVPADSSVPEHKSSSSQFPFDLLVKKTQRNTMGGVSFPTIGDFKEFIKTIKSSFLVPGSDMKRHFQTAREILKSEAATRAQNIKSEPDTDNRSNSAEEGAVQDDTNENEGWSEPTNAVFEQSNQDALEQTPSESPSGSFLGKHFSFSGHMPAEPVNPQDHSVQDFRYLQATYTPHSDDFLTGYDKPEDLQKELGGENSADVSAPLSQPLNSYGTSIYVSARKGQFNASDYLPKHRERPAPTFQPYQPHVGKELQDINRSLKVDSSVSSSSNLSLQSSIGHVDVQLTSPHDSQNHAFTRKQPVRPHPVINVKLSNSLHGYLGDQRVNMINPSILTDEAKAEILGPPEQVSVNQEPEQASENTHAPFSGMFPPNKFDYADFNSLANLAPTPASATVFSRLVGNKVISKNFGIQKVFSGRFPASDVHGARNLPDSFTPQRRGMPLKGGFKGATRTGLLQTLMQPTKVWNRLPNINKEHRNMAYWTPNLLSASKASAISREIWRNDGKKKRLFPQSSQSRSAPFGNAYIVQSRNSYVRGKVSVSKTRYEP